MPNLEGIAFKVIITKNPEYNLAFKTILLGASASQMAYNNSSSGLEATSVQSAIDELASNLDEKADASSVYTKEETDIEISALIDDAHVANNKTWSSEKINSELYDILPVDEASGAIANFDTDVALPLIDVKAEIKAVETGTGAKSPSNPYIISGFSQAVITRSRKNLFDKSKMVINTQRFVKYGVDNYSDTLPDGKFKLQANQAYTFSFSGANSTNFESIGVYDEAGTRVAVVYNNNIASFTPSSTGAYFLAFAVSAGNWGGTWDNYDIQLEFGSTATTYEPYTATQTTIALGQTVYGGELDVINGKLKITHAIKKFSELTWGSSTWGSSTTFSATLIDAKSNSTSTLAGLICEMYNEVTPGSMYSSNNDAICLNTTILRLRDNNFATFEAWKEATENCEVVYPLATPIEVNLTPQQISALLGVNNIWNDTNGDTTVKYKLGIQKYIDKKIAEVQALVL